MERRILIVDDIASNRHILKEMLKNDFDILEAAGGAEAFGILEAHSENIAAVLLDISMPGMDGYEVLTRIRASKLYPNMPVIMITGSADKETRVRSLSLGANDFVMKPYSPEILRHSLRNCIAFHEALATVNVLERDKLTGIWNMEAFFQRAAQEIERRPEGYFVLSCVDIEGFKVINDQYGSEVGDVILRCIAETLQRSCDEHGGICGHLFADQFITLFPRKLMDEHIIGPDLVELGIFELTGISVTVSVGRYLIEDKRLSIAAMFDRASIAKSTVKGRYDTHIALYDESMRSQIVHERTIVNDMNAALAERQFEVWLQPQYNHTTGAMIGAEALVRWRHPLKGMVPPKAFINIFEQNGFIYALDKYVWEEVCRCLRKWIDDGRSPLPVSVNISRYDMFRPDIVEVLMGLIEKYALPLELLRLEITESAFSESSQHIVDVVKELLRFGFTVEIDDFGSGYSSLNTLKDVPAQILKLDMKFLESSDDSQRGGNIVESVVRMAKWLGMSVIAEGVETVEQANFLRSIGCNYMQGYLYARAMPIDEYEEYCRSGSKEEHLLTLETVENLDNNSFWDPNSMDTLIFNSYVGGACIYEYRNGKIDLLRATDKYAQVIGSAGMTVEDALRLDWAKHLEADSGARVVRDLEESIVTKSEVTGEYIFLDLPNCPHETYLRSTMRVIAAADDRYLVYCTNENVTAQRHAERAAREAAEQMKTLMNDTPGGFARMRLHPNGTGCTEYANDGFCEMLGMTREELLFTYRNDLMVGVHPDDVAGVTAEVAQAAAADGLLNTKYRLQTKSGEYVWTQIFARFVKAANGDSIVNCYYADLSEMEKRKLNLRETMPFILSAIMESSQNLDFAKDKDFNYICCSPAFVKFTRQSCEADVIGKTDYDFWTKEEADHFRSDDIRLFEGGKSLINFTEPIPSDDDVQHYSVTSKYIIRDSTGEIIGLYGSGRDVTDTRAAFDRLQLLTDSIPGGIASYTVSPESIKITYFNDGFCNIFGCSREEYTALTAKNGVVSLVFPEDLPGIMEQLAELTAHGTPIDCTYRSRRLDGEGYVWLNLRGVLVDRHDDTAFINAVLYDVTAQHFAEQEAREAAAQVQNMMDDMPGGFVRMSVATDGGAKPIYINDGFVRLLGTSLAEIMDIYAQDTLAGVHPDDVGVVKDFIARMFENGVAQGARYRLMRGDGSYIWLAVLGRVTRGAEGTFLNVYYSDASEQVRQEEAQRALLDNLPCGAGIYELKNGQLSLTYQNKGYWELVGLGEGTYPDAAPMSAVHPDDIPMIMGELSSAVVQGRDVACDIRLRHFTKGYRPVRLVGRIVPTAAGGFLMYATFTPNDSQTVSYQQLLPVVLSAIMGATTDLSFAKDTSFRYLTSSRTFAKMVGQESERDLIGKTDYELFGKDMADKFRRDDEALLASGAAIVDMIEVIPSEDGTRHYSSTSKYLLRDSTGEVIGLYGVGRDITSAVVQNSQLQLINDTIPGGIATYSVKDEHVRVVYCNDGFCKLFGGTREGLKARGDFDPLEWVLETDRAALLAQIDALVKEAVPMDAIFRVHSFGGGFKWINQKAIATERRGDVMMFNAILLDVTERQNYNEKLRISEEENNLAVQHGGSVVCRYDVAEKSLSISPTVAEAYNLSEKMLDVPYDPVRLGLISPESADAYIGFFEAIQRGSHAGTVLYQQRYSGEWRWIEAKSSTVFSDDGRPVKAVISLFDVTERLEKETIYKKWQHSLEDRASDSYTLFRVNLNKNTSYEAREGELFFFDVDAAGLDFNDRAKTYAYQCVCEEDRDRYIAFLNSDAMLAGYYRGKRSDSLDYRELLSDGGMRWIRLTIDLVESPSSTDVEAYLMYENIDEAKRTELQTKALSETDPLTGILNRSTFAAKVNGILAASAPERRHALLMLDIDGFKQVNDVFGHSQGDKTLIDLANGLRSVMRRDDLLARLGGDEFVVFLENVTDSNAAIAKARQIRSVARRSFSMEVKISASVGIAFAPHDGADFDTLYKKADAALYYVKGSGKDDQALYRENMADEHLEPELDNYAPEGTKPAEKKRRMLIVDDSVIDYAMLQNIFRDEFIIEKAKDGNTALIRLRHYGSAISVVLLDLMMPGMDGFAVIEKIQESAELRSIPVIIVSGDESRDTCLSAIRRGATDFITKPVDADLLRIRVRSAVSKAENELLRAKNSLLEYFNGERINYESAFESAGICFVEFDWRTGEFVYHRSVSRYLLGIYDQRPLWQILLSDMVADTRTVQQLQQLVHRVAEGHTGDTVTVKAYLKTPNRETHSFRVTVRRTLNEFEATTRLIIALDDLDYEPK